MIKAQEQLIKKVTKIGNGAHIFAPKNWIGEEIFIVRTPKKSLKEKILSVLSPYLESIEGIYLYGSHARDEAEKDSDIDVFIITNEKLKIVEKGFEIIALQKNKIDKAIKLEPLIIYSILSEAKPLINAKLLNELKEKYKPKLSDFKEYLKDTKRIISINEHFLKLDKKEKREEETEEIPYSLMLRLRGIFIINKLLKSKVYSHEEFKSWVTKGSSNINYDEVYRAYRALKNKSGRKKVKVKDLQNLLNLLKKETFKLESNIYGKKKKTT